MRRNGDLETTIVGKFTVMAPLLDERARRLWAAAEVVRVHDFPGDAIGKAIPYGVYDMARHEAWVSVGRDHDTSAFAVASIRQWWTRRGRRADRPPTPS